MTNRKIIAGNWKMNGLRSSLETFSAIAAGYHGALDDKADAMICPPTTLLAACAHHPDRGALQTGAQDCHVAENGAHTGDISAEMIADCGGDAVIVGHSERRADHGETDALVATKASAAWRAGLTAIICIGETAAERRAGQALAVVESQLAGSLPDGATDVNTIIAYEPVWAIGTGLTPSADDVAEVHMHMRGLLSDWRGDAGIAMRLLYGGSVKPGNANELLNVPHVNGALVGGASLKADDFLGIIDAF